MVAAAQSFRFPPVAAGKTMTAGSPSSKPSTTTMSFPDAAPDSLGKKKKKKKKNRLAAAMNGGPGSLGHIAGRNMGPAEAAFLLRFADNTDIGEVIADKAFGIPPSAFFVLAAGGIRALDWDHHHPRIQSSNTSTLEAAFILLSGHVGARTPGTLRRAWSRMHELPQSSSPTTSGTGGSYVPGSSEQPKQEPKSGPIPGEATES